MEEEEKNSVNDDPSSILIYFSISKMQIYLSKINWSKTASKS